MTSKAQHGKKAGKEPGRVPHATKKAVGQKAAEKDSKPKTRASQEHTLDWN